MENSSTAPWLQDVGGMMKPPTSTLEVSSPSSSTTTARPLPQHMVEKRGRPHKEQALNCPRCSSSNTKFCYYNNYSLTQPRYFCKTCRRYWTEGGSLRNVPVGGGSRKNKRSSSIPTTGTPSSKKLQQDHLLAPPPPLENPNKYMDDLNRGFPHGDFSRFQAMKGSAIDLGGATDGLSAMELLRGSAAATGIRTGGAPFMAMALQEANPVVYSQGPAGGFVLQDFRSGSMNFPVELTDAGGGSTGDNATGGGGGGGDGYECMKQEVEGGGGRVLFPFQDLSHVAPPNGASATAAAAAGSTSNTTDGFDQRPGDSSGFWNGVIGGSGATW